MTVCADYTVTRDNQTFFRQKCVLNTYFTDVIEVQDIILVREIAALLALNSRLDILIRREVVHYQRNFCLVENSRKAVLVELVDGNRACDIVSENHIQLRLNQLSLDNRLQPRVLCQNFLRHCHSHFYSS